MGRGGKGGERTSGSNEPLRAHGGHEKSYGVFFSPKSFYVKNI